MSEHRQDDVTRGFCPQCGRELAAIDVAARGICEEHGRVFAEWGSGYYDEEHPIEDSLLDQEVRDDEG